MKLTVVGGGNTAFGLAASLTLRRFQVALLESPEFASSIEPIITQGGIKIRGVVGEGFARIDLMTTDAKQALAGAEIVFICVPAYAHQRMAEHILPHLMDGQIVLLMPGNAGGALEFARLLKQKKMSGHVMVAEASSCLFACKKDAPDAIWVRGLKQGLPVAAFPAKHTDQVVRKLQETFSEFSAARHVLETSLTNINHMVHPPGTLLNTGHIELAKEDWLFFREGVSPAVCHVIEAIDRERVEIIARLNMPPITVLDWLLQFYSHQGMKGKTLFEAVSTSPVYAASKAPHGIGYRYVTEDVPYGLVPIASIGKQLGLKTPAIDTLISLASMVSGKDWLVEGRTADKMGLAGLSANQMIEFAIEGE
jgi:opine dehydrogenase